MWCDRFSDVGGGSVVTIEEGVFVTLIAIFKKKIVVFTSKSYQVVFFTCFLVQILLLYLPVNCVEGEQIIRGIRGCFSLRVL